MSKKYLIFFMLFPFVVFVLWNGYMMATVRESQPVKLVIQGYDPRNLLSGRYVEFQIDWARSACTQFKGNECPTEDFEGITRFYVPEAKADWLSEKLNRDENMSVFEAVYAYVPGRRPIMTDLLIDGISWNKE